MSFRIAKAYLDKLMDLKLGDETMSQLMRGLRARRTALELLSKLANFIQELADDGAIQEGQVDALLHELEHDAVHLRANKAPTLDGTAGRSQGALPVSEVAQFVLELNSLREATLAELIEKGYADVEVKHFSFPKIPTEVRAPMDFRRTAESTMPSHQAWIASLAQSDHDKEIVKLAKHQDARAACENMINGTASSSLKRACSAGGGTSSTADNSQQA